MGAGRTSRLERWLLPLLSARERRRVALAVEAAEKKTSGEIHVHLCRTFAGREPLEFARETFRALGLDKTRRRNGVLIAVAGAERRLAVWGDRGIHEAAGQALWDGASALLAARLREDRAADGVVECVEAVGRELARLFPPEPGDENELPDEVSAA